MAAMGGTTRIPAADLSELVRRCCEGVGLSRSDSEAVAAVLLYANLRGQDAHGIARLPNYMKRVTNGLATGSEQMCVVAESGPLRRLDAGRTIGPAAATKVTDLAIEVAQEHGVAVIGLGNATHFGPAGYYARRAAKLGLIGIVVSNGPKAVAPHGAAEPLLGTNPLALAVPAGGHGEMVLDMATGAISRGQVRQAARSETPLPPASALGPDGHPTVEPQAALRGSILPISGPKGSGLALAISLLTILLADAQADDEMGSLDAGATPREAGEFPLFNGSVGQVFLVIDPGRLLGPSSLDRVEAFVDRLHDLRPARGFEAPLIPGELGDAIAAERLEQGILVDLEQLDAVAQTCREHDLGALAGWLQDRYLGR
jgi:LDH2 family malate/lactate/ureidoglycolate dehydrogenase